MKTLLVISLIIYLALQSTTNNQEKEHFFSLKCIIYLFVSSIHSTILSIPVPIGAIVMYFYSLSDIKNHIFKVKLILSGLVIFFLSILNFTSFISPFQKAYLTTSISNISKVEVYSKSNDYTKFLFSFSNEQEISHLTRQLLLSKPSTNWYYKILPSDMGYLLKLYTSSAKVTEIYISLYPTADSNLYIGNQFFAYYNKELINYINTLYSRNPIGLTLNTTNNTSTNITNTSLLSSLWRCIIWNKPVDELNRPEESFNIISFLFFESHLGFKLNFSSDFNYAQLINGSIIEIPPYLQHMLNEQLILSNLNPVNKFQIFNETYTSTKIVDHSNFSIERDLTDLSYGLYYYDYKNDEKLFLHTVNSTLTKFFILKYPYILILDSNNQSNYYLMLINQNIPDKHRYISKNETILPQSLSICPENTKFAYITKHGQNTSLFLVTDYYHSPKVIATGGIIDSLFLSDDYIVFTQKINDISFLCVYSITYNQFIKYTPTPGAITLIKSVDNKVYFCIQQTRHNTPYEGVFYIDTDLKIYKFK